uniref:Uncharacterized protein n=1 Tax=Heterorhabditis bacteriophora TaxID=37862 RepID=A0A1I7WWB4_HETBA
MKYSNKTVPSQIKHCKDTTVPLSQSSERGKILDTTSKPTLIAQSALTEPYLSTMDLLRMRDPATWRRLAFQRPVRERAARGYLLRSHFN